VKRGTQDPQGLQDFSVCLEREEQLELVEKKDQRVHQEAEVDLVNLVKMVNRVLGVCLGAQDHLDWLLLKEIPVHRDQGERMDYKDFPESEGSLDKLVPRGFPD